MTEHLALTERFRAGRPLHVGAVTLLPIERVAVRWTGYARWAWFSVAVDPYALVVRHTGCVRALDADAVPISLEHLREKLPELDGLLAALAESNPHRALESKHRPAPSAEAESTAGASVNSPELRVLGGR